MTPGMCTIQFAQQEYWSITSKLDLGIKFKVKKEVGYSHSYWLLSGSH